MPYYRITIFLKNKKKYIGIRESTITDINRAWQYYEKKAYTQFPGTAIASFELVMVSRHSNDVQDYLKQKKRPPID